jgi:hypothetical protein
MIRSTPYGNSMTLDLAKAAIENEKLGAGAVTDFPGSEPFFNRLCWPPVWSKLC